MKNIFRIAVIAIALTTMTAVTANAQQKGDMAAGANIVLGSGGGVSNFGLGAKFQYQITEPIRLEGSFTYFMPKNYVSMWNLSANAHYLFPVAEGITIYPLAGLGILGASVSYDYGYGISGGYSDTDFGLNIGGGCDYALSESMTLNAELKYSIGGVWSRLMLSAGIAFKF